MKPSKLSPVLLSLAHFVAIADVLICGLSFFGSVRLLAFLFLVAILSAALGDLKREGKR